MKKDIMEQFKPKPEPQQHRKINEAQEIPIADKKTRRAFKRLELGNYSDADRRRITRAAYLDRWGMEDTKPTPSREENPETIIFDHALTPIADAQRKANAYKKMLGTAANYLQAFQESGEDTLFSFTITDEGFIRDEQTVGKEIIGTIAEQAGKIKGELLDGGYQNKIGEIEKELGAMII